MLYGEEKLGPN